MQNLGKLIFEGKMVADGVAATNTAAENTAALANVLQRARDEKKGIILPGGVIRHNGLPWYEGTLIEGQGITKTVLLNESGQNCFYDPDSSNQNQFLNGGLVSNMTIDGNNIADYGLNIRNNFFIKVSSVVFRRQKQFGAKYEGILTPYFDFVKFQEGANGISIDHSLNSSYGGMQANMCRFTMCYFAELQRLGARINEASDVVFDQCNFENTGVLGDPTTGGIYATNMSSANEGIDIIIQNGWCEGLRGPMLNIEAGKGRSVIHNQMCNNVGNGMVQGQGIGVVNSGSKLLISGATDIKNFQHDVWTEKNGQTFVDGFANVGTHVEYSGGTFKKTTYA